MGSVGGAGWTAAAAISALARSPSMMPARKTSRSLLGPKKKERAWLLIPQKRLNGLSRNNCFLVGLSDKQRNLTDQQNSNQSQIEVVARAVREINIQAKTDQEFRKGVLKLFKLWSQQNETQQKLIDLQKEYIDWLAKRVANLAQALHAIQARVDKHLANGS